MERKTLRALVLTICAGLTTIGLTAQEGQTDELLASAQQFLSQVSRGEFEKAAESFDAAVAKALPPEKLEQTWKQLTTAFGELQRFGDAKMESVGALRAVITPCHFERGILNARIVFDPKDKITGLWFAPPTPTAKYTWPRYVRPQSFEETDVTVGQGEWELPGTLTLPKGEGPYPAVVLIHGSGPNDRDETIGPTKVFRDLAGGLATEGIAVQRYDKRTKVHGQKLAKRETGITLQEETIDDALLAIELLREHPAVDPERIFVLGHSLGGYAAPRIAKSTSSLAGLILLAGSNRPLEDMIVDQTRYLALSDGQASTKAQEMLDKIAAQAAEVKTLTPESVVAKEDLPLGVPLSYWMDMRSYDPIKTARNLAVPMLLLQGGRDYQVTAADYGRWHEGLKGRDAVTFKWLPTLNHLFIAGKKRSVPAEYMQPGHVSPKVIEIVATWIKQKALPAE